MRRPRTGEPVVLDANILKEWFLELDRPGRRVAQALHESCAQFRYSPELAKEAMSAIHRHGSPVPRTKLLAFFEGPESKLGKVARSKTDSISIEGPVRERLPHEDVHVVQLALACRAVCLVTGDSMLHESLNALRTVIGIEAFHPGTDSFDD